MSSNHTTCRRRDIVGAAYVEAAIKIAHKSGRERAEVFLRRQAVVSDEVVDRVLSSPPDALRKRTWLRLDDIAAPAAVP
jgi:hypothetical protein